VTAEQLENVAREFHEDWLRTLRHEHNVHSRHAPWDEREAIAVPWSQLSQRARAYSKAALWRQIRILENHGLVRVSEKETPC
jgi:hypothetical protein